jgi:hypothetical protein
MRVKLTQPRNTMPTEHAKGEILPIGTTIEHPDAFWLCAVLEGKDPVALPDDEECLAKVDAMRKTHSCFTPPSKKGAVITKPGQPAAKSPAA